MSSPSSKETLWVKAADGQVGIWRCLGYPWLHLGEFRDTSYLGPTPLGNQGDLLGWGK